MDLEKIKGIGSATAERMRSVGIDSVEKIANINLQDLLKVKGIGESTALRYIDEAKKLLEGVVVTPEIESTSNDIEEKINDSPTIESPSKEIKKRPAKDEISIKAFKEIIKKQAECNIGLVGHVDHGMSYLDK